VARIIVTLVVEVSAVGTYLGFSIACHNRTTSVSWKSNWTTNSSDFVPTVPALMILSYSTGLFISFGCSRKQHIDNWFGGPPDRFRPIGGDD